MEILDQGKNLLVYHKLNWIPVNRAPGGVEIGSKN